MPPALTDLSKGALPLSVLAGVVMLVFSMGVAFATLSRDSSAAVADVARLEQAVAALRAEFVNLRVEVARAERSRVQYAHGMSPTFEGFCRRLRRHNRSVRCPSGAK